MRNSIKILKEGVINFFEKGTDDSELISFLQLLFNYETLELSEFGCDAINARYGRKFPYMVAVNRDSTEMVILVYRPKTETELSTISMYCVSFECIYEYRDNLGNNSIPIEDWKGRRGTAMTKMAIEFKDELIPKSLVRVTEGIGPDIVEFTRNLSLS